MIKKILVLSLLILLFCPVIVLSQNKQFDTARWTGLRTELIKRTDAILLFQVRIMRSKEIDKKLWAELAVDALNLAKKLDSSKTINSAAIKTTTKLNSKLSKTFGQILMQLMMHDQKTLNESAEITAKMEAIEKQLMVLKEAYNKACAESNRPDLVFDERHRQISP
ncbi:MAG TPA: hypothetical protein VF623_15850 [Segetibacter sp.]